VGEGGTKGAHHVTERSGAILVESAEAEREWGDAAQTVWVRRRFGEVRAVVRARPSFRAGSGATVEGCGVCVAVEEEGSVAEASWAAGFASGVSHVLARAARGGEWVRWFVYQSEAEKQPAGVSPARGDGWTDLGTLAWGERVLAWLLSHARRLARGRAARAFLGGPGEAAMHWDAGDPEAGSKRVRSELDEDEGAGKRRRGEGSGGAGAAETTGAGGEEAPAVWWSRDAVRGGTPEVRDLVRARVQPLLLAAIEDAEARRGGGAGGGGGGVYREGRWAGLSMVRTAVRRDLDRMGEIVADSLEHARAVADGRGLGASLCVIVPYREQKEQNRGLQLTRFLAELPAILERVAAGGRLRRWHILIVEQATDGFKFNRGKLLNVGIRLARSDNLGPGGTQLGRAAAPAAAAAPPPPAASASASAASSGTWPAFNAYCLHDVDLLPRAWDVTRLYAVVPGVPVHPGYAWSKYGYERYCGGIVTLGDVQIDRSGAFPNDFWGWGGEDDVLSLRMQKVGFPAKTYLRPDRRGDGKSGADSLVEDLEETVRSEVGAGVRASEHTDSRFMNEFKSMQISAAVLQAATRQNCVDDCQFAVQRVERPAACVTKVTVHLFPERDPHAQRLQAERHQVPPDLRGAVGARRT
jgi:hypothetical protein